MTGASGLLLAPLALCLSCAASLPGCCRPASRSDTATQDLGWDFRELKAGGYSVGTFESGLDARVETLKLRQVRDSLAAPRCPSVRVR